MNRNTKAAISGAHRPSGRAPPPGRIAQTLPAMVILASLLAPAVVAWAAPALRGEVPPLGKPAIAPLTRGESLPGFRHTAASAAGTLRLRLIDASGAGWDRGRVAAGAPTLMVSFARPRRTPASRAVDAPTMPLHADRGPQFTAAGQRMERSVGRIRGRALALRLQELERWWSAGAQDAKTGNGEDPRELPAGAALHLASRASAEGPVFTAWGRIARDRLKAGVGDARMGAGVTMGPRAAGADTAAPLAGEALAAVEEEGTFAVTSGTTLTLNDAIRLALRNNRSLLDARAARAVQEFALDVAGDRYRPKVSIGPSAHARASQDSTADVSVQTGLRVPTGGQLTGRWARPLTGEDDASGTLSVGFSQPLLKGFGVDVDTAPLRVAKLREKIDALAFREAIAGVVVSTIHAWRDLVRARRQLAIGEASLAQAREQRKTNRTLIEAGQMAAREILQSDANIADRELGLVQMRNAVTSANFALIDILDIDTATLIDARETPVAERPVPSVEEALETALRHWPGHALGLLEKEIAEIELQAAENDRLWDLSLGVEVSRNASGDAGRTDRSVGVRLSIPLGDRSSDLRLARARAAVRQAERGVAELRQSVGIAVRRAVHEVEVGLRRIELARSARALAQEKLAIERSKLRQGLSSTFRVNRFEEDLVRAQNAEVNAVVDYENAIAALDQTLGTTLDTWGIRVEEVGR